MERTLIIFKPDAIMRGLVGEILSRFEKAGLKIVGTKMLNANEEQLHGHYESIGTLRTRKGEAIFTRTVAHMQYSPLILMVLEGVEAVEFVRKMVGPTEPKSAQPGTIRGDYAHVSYGQSDAANVAIPNLIHASATKQEADQEIAHWFAESELFEYANVHDRFTQPQSK